MTERVQEILGWYANENPGTRMNLARLLNHGRLGGTGKLVILPVDQGFEHGPARSFAPNPAGYDPHYHFQLAIDAGCNAYAAPLGFIEAGVDKFLDRVPLILKLNNHDSLHDEKDPLSSVTSSRRRSASRLPLLLVPAQLPTIARKPCRPATRALAAPPSTPMISRSPWGPGLTRTGVKTRASSRNRNSTG